MACLAIPACAFGLFLQRFAYYDGELVICPAFLMLILLVNEMFQSRVALFVLRLCLALCVIVGMSRVSVSVCHGWVTQGRAAFPAPSIAAYGMHGTGKTLRSLVWGLVIKSIPGVWWRARLKRLLEH